MIAKLDNGIKCRPMKLDAIDLRILSELQQDGSVSNVDLARRVHLSPSPCLARVKALEREGVIQRYGALANPKSLGLGLNVTKAIAAIIVMMWNFVVNRAVTFRSVKWQTRAEEPLESAL